ncbi:MAG: hypothetical protein RIF33_11815 [Cyclobacteriaceae bacterium]
MKQYLFGSISIALALLGAYYLANDQVFNSILHDQFPALILFFFLQSLVVAWLIDLAEKTNWESPIYALGTITFRFLTSLFFIAVLFVSKLADMKTLMAQFLVVYLVYLVFELYTVLSNLRRN